LADGPATGRQHLAAGASLRKARPISHRTPERTGDKPCQSDEAAEPVDMDPEGTRNDAPPTVVDMSLSAIHGSTNGSGRKDSACGQDFQITLCVARRVPPGPETFAGTRKPGVQPKAPDRASRAPESRQKRPRHTTLSDRP